MLVLSTAHLLRIEKHARDSYPEECCGVLVGVNDGARRVTAVHRTRNTAPRGTRDSYEIDPRDLHQLLRQLRACRAQILGFYHSHPDAAPLPSGRDVEKAWPSYSYLIVSVHNGDPLSLRSWRWSNQDHGFEQEPIQVTAVGPALGWLALEHLRQRV